MPKKFRWHTPTRSGRLLGSIREAREAAVKAKAAHKDEATGRIYLDVFTEIEERV